MSGLIPGSVRLALLALIVLAVVLLSVGGATWSTPTHAQGGTIPEATQRSGPSRAPEPTTAGAVAPIEQLPPDGGRGQVAPGAGMTVTAGDQSCLIIIMPGDIDIDGTIQIAPYPVDQLPSRNSAYTYIRSCEVKLFDANGNLVPYARFATTAGRRYTANDDLMFGVRFAAPVDVCFPYTDADLARAGGNPGSFVALYYDPQGGWIELSLVLDPVKYIVCGVATQAGIFALALRQAGTLGLPNSSGQIPEGVAGAAGLSAPQAANAASTAVPSPATSATASTQSAGGAPVAEAAAGAPPVAGATAPLATPIAAPAGMPAIWLIMLLMIVMLATLMLVLHRRSAGK